MENKQDKPIRVQFPKDATSKDILAIIRKLQDDWALKHPERAHELYPKRYPRPTEEPKK